MAKTIAERNIIFKYQAQTAKANRDLDKLEKKTGNVSKAFGGALEVAKGFAAVAIGTNLIQGISQLVTSAGQLAIQNEQTAISFEVLLGSADAAKKKLEELNSFANQTNFSNDQIQAAGKSLLAFGEDTDNVVNVIGRLGDISNGTGKDINELAVLYGKARVQGTLFAEDINQLTEAGVDVISEFGKQLGVSNSQVKKLASEGKINFNNLERAIIDITGSSGKFFNLTAKQSQTVGGVISTLRGNFNELLKAIGTKFLPNIKQVVSSIGDLVGGLREMISPTVDAATANKRLQVEFNNEIEVLKEANFSQKERADAIREINVKYKDYLPNLINEAASLDEIAEAQKQVNQAFAEKAIFIAAEEEINEILKKQVENIKLAAAAEKGRAQAVVESNKNTLDSGRFQDFLQTQVGLNESLRKTALDAASATPGEIDGVKATYETLAGELGTTLDDIFARFREKADKNKPVATALGVDKKALEKQKKEINDAAKQIQDLETALIEDSFLRREDQAIIASFRTVSALVGTPEQIKQQTELLRKQLGQELKKIKAERDAVISDSDTQTVDTPFLNFDIDGLAKDKVDQQLAKLKQEVQIANNIELDVEIRKESIQQALAGAIDLFGQFSDIVVGQAQAASQGRIDALDEEIDNQRTRVSDALAIAEEGNAEALQLEQDRLDFLEKRRADAVKKQKQLANVELAVNAALTISNQILAISKAGKDVPFPANLIAIASIIGTLAATAASIKANNSSIPAFRKGTEFFEPGAGSRKAANGEYPAYLTKGERVLTAEQNAKLKGLTNQQLVSSVLANKLPNHRVDVSSFSRASVNQSDKNITKGLRDVRESIEGLKIGVTMDSNGFHVGLEKRMVAKKRRGSRNRR